MDKQHLIDWLLDLKTHSHHVGLSMEQYLLRWWGMEKVLVPDIQEVEQKVFSPGLDMEQQEPAPALDMEQQEPAPALDMEQQEPAPALDMEQQESAPALDMEHVVFVPSLDMQSEEVLLVLVVQMLWDDQLHFHKKVEATLAMMSPQELAGGKHKPLEIDLGLGQDEQPGQKYPAAALDILGAALDILGAV